MPRYLGQHFLVRKEKLRKLVEALDLKPTDTVVEIGPGHGELTREIVHKFISLKVNKFRIITIEKDLRLASELKNQISSSNLEIIQGDALKIIPTLTYQLKNLKTYKLTGNIPYYITGRLLRILSGLKNKPSLIVLTLQKEVAERICALRQAQGKPKMNLLAASVQFWAEPKIIGYISKKDFRPQPKVDSAIIKLSPRIYTDNKRIDADRYYRFIRILFKQPRKTILNNLLNIGRPDLPKIDENIRRSDLQKLLQKIGVNPSDRPQNLSIEQIVKLSNSFQ